jgi:hypothetical protein
MVNLIKTEALCILIPGEALHSQSDLTWKSGMINIVQLEENTSAVKNYYYLLFKLPRF